MGDFSSFKNGFISQATEVVISHLEQSEFSVSELARELHLSREQAHRKLKKETGLSSGKFIRYVRLLFAYSYLKVGSEPVQQVGYKVGFNNPGYFNKCFKEAWLVTPGEVIRENASVLSSNLPILHFYQFPEIQEVLRNAGVVLEPVFNDGESHKVGRKYSKAWYVLLISIVCVLGTLQINSSQDYRKVNIDNQRLAVVPFVNTTGDTLFQAIGDIASSWISSQIDGLDNVKTVPFFTIKQYGNYLGILPNDLQKRPTFGEVVGASYILQGRYFLKGGKLFFDTELLDAKTQESIYHLPMMSGSQDSVMEVVETLRLKIAGLITNIEEVQLGKLTPPNYQAYKYYLKGLHELRNGFYPSEALENFEKAASIEPDFVMPHLYRLWYRYGEEKDSIIARIEQIPRITEYEKSIFNHMRLRIDHNYAEGLRLSLKMVKDYPNDYYFNTMAAHEAKSQFMPRFAMRILTQLQDPLESDVGLMWHYFKVTNYTESLMALEEYQEALDYLQNIPTQLFNLAIPEHLIYTYIRLGKGRDFIDELISSYDLEDEKIIADFYSIAAYEYTLIDKDSDGLYFIGKASKIMRSFPDERGHSFDMVDLLFMAHDFLGARKQLEKIKDQNEVDYWAYLSFIEAAKGNASSAIQIHDQELPQDLIRWRRNPLDYQADYMKARVYALLGQKEKAITMLENALQKGQLCHHLDFQRDIFLKPIFGMDRFQELVKPREYTGEITIVQ